MECQEEQKLIASRNMGGEMEWGHAGRKTYTLMQKYRDTARERVTNTHKELTADRARAVLPQFTWPYLHIYSHAHTHTHMHTRTHTCTRAYWSSL